MIRKATGTRTITPLLALSAITLAVYLMALKAGFLAVDDTVAIRFIQSGKVNIAEMFLFTGKLYYRPLAMLSLLADFHLYGGNPAGYHLTNLLIHLANVLLVYYLSALLLEKENHTSVYPFLAALVFAIHPVNSEAVVWISARPDLLCCFFFLVSLILIIKRNCTVTLPVAAALFVTFFCSLASKEASLFLPLLVIAWFVLNRENIPARNGIAASAALLLATLAYLILRKGLPLAPSTEAAASVHQASHTFAPIIDGAAALGFYLGKLLYPFPLNFAITEIPATLCTGVFLLFVAAAAALWTKLPATRFPFMFLATSLIPPLGALFLSTAWTPYAERYLYLPSVAYSLSAIIVLRGLAAGIPRPVLVCAVMLAAIPTAYRVHLWVKPVAFWQDAVLKSPRFGNLRLPLAAELIEEGRFEEANHALKRADELGFTRKEAGEFSRQLRKMIVEQRRVPYPSNGGSRKPVASPYPSSAQIPYAD